MTIIEIGDDMYHLENQLHIGVEEKLPTLVRTIANDLADIYKGNATGLRDLFDSDDSLVRGVATSAYTMITKDPRFISKEEFGGLGITLEEGANGLKVSKKQLMFAHGRGSSFRNLYTFEDSGYKMKGEQLAFKGSVARGKSQIEIEGNDASWQNSRFYDKTGATGRGYGDSFSRVVAHDDSLNYFLSRDRSMNGANFYDNSGRFIVQDPTSLKDAIAHGDLAFKDNNSAIKRIYA